MLNRRDTSPTYDYDELQRRHAEFKERKRQAMLKKDAPEDDAAASISTDFDLDQENPAPVSEKAPAAPKRTPAPEAVKPESFEEEPFNDVEIPQEEAENWDDAPGDIEDYGEDYIDQPGDEGDFEEDYPEDDNLYANEAQQNPNPFDSFLNAFSRLKGHLKKRKAPDEAEDYGDYDYEEEFSPEHLDEVQDEEYYEEQPAPTADDIPESPISRPAERSRPVKVAESNTDAADAEDIEDVTAEDAPRAYGARPTMADNYRESYDDGDYAPDDEDYEGDYADEDFDEADAPEKPVGKFTKFIRLFVEPVGDDELDESDEDEENWDEDAADDDAYEAPSAPRTSRNYEAQDASDYVPIEITRVDAQDAEDAIEGGLDTMADLNRIDPELSRKLAADLENQGLSRRERRELAAKQAAEAAARLAEEEIKFTPVAEPVKEAPAEPLFAEAPLEADTVEDVSSGIVEIEETAHPAIDMSIVDEPTREFKPVSKMSFDEYMDAVNDDLDDDEADEDEDEEDEKPAKGLFGRRKARKVEEDYDDGEDEDDEDDEEEDEDEKPRRGLFGRRKARKVEEDDDEDDDYDDYDDEDEEEEEEEEAPRKRSRKSRRQDRYDDEDDYDDDDYDDYDDEDDYNDDDYDDDEDDYDEGGSSFGRSILRFFTVILSLVLIFAIVLLGANILNVVDVISLTPLAERMPEKVADIFLFSEDTKKLLASENGDADVQGIPGNNAVIAPTITMEPTTEAPTEAPAQVPTEAPTSIPEATNAAPATVG